MSAEHRDTGRLKERLLPLILTLAVVVIDQVTKAAVASNIRLGTIGWALGGDLVRIIHVTNPGVAFSMGSAWPGAVRRVIFALVPLAALCCVLVVYLRSTMLTQLQRWCVCGVLGGGAGNLIDRFFRPAGVVDFIDVKFFGIFGMERWPTFNVADSAIVVAGLILLLSFIVVIKNTDAIAQGGQE